MSDNFVSNAGSGGSTFRADDNAGVLYPVVKVAWGGDGSFNETSTSVPVPMQVVTTTNGGATPFRLNGGAASTNATSLKASAGKLMSLCVVNTNASLRFLKFYNKASAPTVGTDTPVMTYAVPASSSGAGFVAHLPVDGIAFSTGIAYATTTAGGDSDTGAITAGDLYINGSYI